MRRVPIRVVCHAILRRDAEPASIRALRCEVDRLCQARGAMLLDFVTEAHAVPRSLDDFPALLYLRNSVADVPLVVRSVDGDREQPRDVLDAVLLTEESPIA